MAAINPNTHWVWREKPPLFYEPVSDHSIEIKVANMKAAIIAGADVNELDHEFGGRHAGRPLHYIMDSGKVNLDIMNGHLPLVKLLLEHGADPRLRGRSLNSWPGTPMDEAQGILRLDLIQEPQWEVIVPFYKEALALMKQVADHLDAQDAADAVTKDCSELERNHTQHGSFFGRVKFW